MFLPSSWRGLIGAGIMKLPNHICVALLLFSFLATSLSNESEQRRGQGFVFDSSSFEALDNIAPDLFAEIDLVDKHHQTSCHPGTKTDDMTKAVTPRLVVLVGEERSEEAASLSDMAQAGLAVYTPNELGQTFGHDLNLIGNHKVAYVITACADDLSAAPYGCAEVLELSAKSVHALLTVFTGRVELLAMPCAQTAPEVESTTGRKLLKLRKTRRETEVTSGSNSASNEAVGSYPIPLSPVILTGILISFLFFFIGFSGFLAMYALQTPSKFESPEGRSRTLEPQH